MKVIEGDVIKIGKLELKISEILIKEKQDEEQK